MNKKKCTCCNLEFDFSEFTKDKNSHDGMDKYCKICKKKQREDKQKEWNKNYRENNKETVKKNRENTKTYMQEYRENNKELLNKKARENYKKDPKKFINRNKEYLKNNKNARIAANLRSRLNKALKGECKSKKTLELLGCSSEEYIKYLEENFQEGMSWENYGKKSGKDRWWEIDHTIPLSKYDLKDENQLAEANHYLNTKPMWQEENIKKSNNLDENSIKELSKYGTEEYINNLKEELENKKMKSNESITDKLKDKYQKDIQFKNLPKELKEKYFKLYIEKSNAHIINSDLSNLSSGINASSITIQCNNSCKCTTISLFEKIAQKNWFCYNVSQIDNVNFYQFFSNLSSTVKQDFIEFKAQQIINITNKICKKCNLELDISHFQKCLKYSDGYSNSCINCLKKNPDSDKPIHCLPVEERFDRIKKILNDNNCQFVSGEYINRDSVLKVKCNCGNTWDTKASYLIANNFCNLCQNNTYSIEANKSRSDKLSDFYSSETGKKNKKLAHEKRSETMKLRNDELKKNITHKTCSQCNINKEIAFFNKRKTSKDGFNGICSECSIMNRKKYR